MAPTTTVVTTKVQTESPYKLDKSQVSKASSALVSHIKKEIKQKEENAEKKNLLAGDKDSSEDSDDVQAIWLIVTTKKHIVDQKRLKPGKILLPHSLNKAGTSVCLFTTDPQRSFKDIVAHPSFPPDLGKQIRVLGLSKLKERTKSFQERRRLLEEHDVFLADDRIVPTLPKTLGKIFFESSKRPVPISLEGNKPRENGKRVKSQKDPNNRLIAEPKMFAKEIEKALSSARVHLSPSTSTSIKVGFSNFTGEQLTENIHTVVDGMVEKFITKGWRNIKAIHIKGPETVAFPLWMADELWVDETDILEDEHAEKMKQVGSQKGTKRKGRDIEDGENPGKKKTKLLSDEASNKEDRDAREALRKAKKEAKGEAEKRVIVSEVEVVKKGDGGKKTKIKKTKVIEAAA